MRHYRALVLLFSLTYATQFYAAAHPKKLVVNGHLVQSSLIQRQGHYYVSLDDLARTLNGKVQYDGEQITFILPDFSDNTAGTVAAATPAKEEQVQPSALSAVGGAQPLATPWCPPPTNPTDNKLTDEFIAQAKRTVVAIESFGEHTDPFETPAFVTETYKTEAVKALQELDVAAKSVGDRNLKYLLSSYYVTTNLAFQSVSGRTADTNEYKRSLLVASDYRSQVQTALAAGQYAGGHNTNCK
jgi:hypothetical protein